MHLHVATSYEELKTHINIWDRLSRNSIERNIFYEPWMFLPAFKHLREQKVSVILVWNTTKRRKPLLTGFFPFTHESGYGYMPIKYLKTWRHQQCFLCTPLIYRGYEQETLQTLFHWLDRSPDETNLMQLDNFAAEGPFFRHLNTFLNKERYLFQQTNDYTRSLLYSEQSSKKYLSCMNERSLAKLQRKRKALSQQGALRLYSLDRKEDLEEWLNSFLAMEASGWKGRNNSALACSSQEVNFFKEVAREAFSRQKLLMTSLKIAKQAVAMQCAFRSGGCGFAFKIAYNETYAKYSPGVILHFEQLKYFCDKTSLKWVDSCSTPGTPLDSLWKGRRKIKSLAISNKQLSSRSILFLSACMKKAATTLRTIYRPAGTA